MAWRAPAQAAARRAARAGDGARAAAGPPLAPLTVSAGGCVRKSPRPTSARASGCTSASDASSDMCRTRAPSPTPAPPAAARRAITPAAGAPAAHPATPRASRETAAGGGGRRHACRPGSSGPAAARCRDRTAPPIRAASIVPSLPALRESCWTRPSRSRHAWRGRPAAGRRARAGGGV